MRQIYNTNGNGTVLYHTHMVHTIRIYTYGMTIRVWYGLLYHTRMGHMRPLVYNYYYSYSSIIKAIASYIVTTF